MILGMDTNTFTFLSMSRSACWASPRDWLFSGGFIKNRVLSA